MKTIQYCKKQFELYRFIQSLFCCVLIVLFASCKKDLYESNSDLVSQLNGFNAFLIGESTSESVNGISYHDSTILRPGISAILNTVASRDVKITAVIDTTLAASINQLYQSNDSIPLSNMFGLNPNTITILSGSLQSKDSLFGYLKDGKVVKSNATYIVPVRLSAEDGISLKSSIAFFKMRVFLNKYYGRMFGGTYAYASDPYNSFYSNPINGYYTFDITSYKINNGNVDDIIINLDAGPSSPFKYDTLKIRGSMNYDDSLFKSYNSVMNSSYNFLKMPSENIEVSNDTWVVPSDYYFATNQFSFTIKNISSLVADSNYLFVVQLPKETRVGYLPPDTSTSNTIVYVKFNCNNILSKNVDSTNSIVIGNAIERSNWNVSSSEGVDSNYYSNPPSNAIDGDVSTYWAPMGYASSQSLYINMNSIRNVKGFRITPNYDDLTKDILRAEILTSNDNINWTSQGYYLGSVTNSSSTIDDPDYKYIHFLNPVNAQYYRIRITSTSNYYKSTSIPEINAYE